MNEIDVTVLRTPSDVQACQKCGSEKGWDGPKYQYDRPTFFVDGAFIDGSEWLVYTCRVCEYRRSERTRDYKPPKPKRPEPPKNRVIKHGISWLFNWHKGKG